MLTARLNTPFRAVYSLDPSLIDVLSNDEIIKYRRTRRFGDIEEKISKAEEPTTVFHCTPLLVKFEHFADQAAVNGLESDAAWRIFRTHVTKVENFGDKVLFDDDGLMKNDEREKFPRDVIDEIAFAIVESANLETRGFTLPRTFSEMLIRARLARLRATDASTSSADKSPSDTTAG